MLMGTEVTGAVMLEIVLISPSSHNTVRELLSSVSYLFPGTVNPETTTNTLAYQVAAHFLKHLGIETRYRVQSIYGEGLFL